ncbi:hypothetical protein GN956_G20240 [Arapaima gigas]
MAIMQTFQCICQTATYSSFQQKAVPTPRPVVVDSEQLEPFHLQFLAGGTAGPASVVPSQDLLTHSPPSRLLLLLAYVVLNPTPPPNLTFKAPYLRIHVEWKQQLRFLGFSVSACLQH